MLPLFIIFTIWKNYLLFFWFSYQLIVKHKIFETTKKEEGTLICADAIIKSEDWKSKSEDWKTALQDLKTICKDAKTTLQDATLAEQDAILMEQDASLTDWESKMINFYLYLQRFSPLFRVGLWKAIR